jgi:large subunit ribosomal protein L1
MAKTKKELLAQLEGLGVEVNPKSTIAELTELIAANQTVAEPVVADVNEAAGINDEVAETVEEPSDTQTAKAGKRSAKALQEAEEKQAKEERKASGEAAEAKPKVPVTPSRPRSERRGKHFRKQAELIDKTKNYTLREAVDLAQKTSYVKFDATVEMHINLDVDPRHADQNIRDNLVLPAGTGKNVRVAVASDELLAQLDKGVIDFDVLVATPDFMPKLGKHARTLGPRGLMPNPKSGTVTTDIDKAIAEAKAGRVEYRVDTTGIIHLGVGKVSFTSAQLLENAQAVLTSVRNNKPQSVKGNYLKAIHLTTTMGPSVNVDIASTNITV